MVDYNCPAVTERFYRMTDAGWHDRYQPRPSYPSHAVDGHFELSRDHFVHFFLRMAMLVNRSASREIVMRECHAVRMKISSKPTRQTLDDTKIIEVHKRHRKFLRDAY